MTEDYSFQPFSMECYPQMNSLFVASFQKELDWNYFQKKYDTASLGHPVIGYLAMHKATNQPAAYYGVFPLQILIDGKAVLAAQSGDTMTHPDHRKKGLFTYLANRCFDQCRAKGIALVYGQPNRYSYHGLVHSLHFEHPDDIIRYDLKLNIKTFPLAKLFQKAGQFTVYLKWAEARLKKRMLPAPDHFLNSLETVYGKILRDKDYLEYKNEPGKLFIQVGPAIVWVRLTDVFLVGDINDYTLVDEAVIMDLRRIAWRLGYNTIVFYLNKSLDLPFLRYFEKKESWASSILYLDQNFAGKKLVITAADFDTW
jgi:GNAT superfamily N-acetyltransferase